MEWCGDLNILSVFFAIHYSFFVISFVPFMVLFKMLNIQLYQKIFH